MVSHEKESCQVKDLSCSSPVRVFFFICACNAHTVFSPFHFFCFYRHSFTSLIFFFFLLTCFVFVFWKHIKKEQGYVMIFFGAKKYVEVSRSVIIKALAMWIMLVWRHGYTSGFSPFFFCFFPYPRIFLRCRDDVWMSCLWFMELFPSIIHSSISYINKDFFKWTHQEFPSSRLFFSNIFLIFSMRVREKKIVVGPKKKVASGFFSGRRKKDTCVRK